MCSCTGHSRPRTVEQRTVVTRQIIYKNKEEDHFLKPTPGVPDNTVYLRIGHLNFLVTHALVHFRIKTLILNSLIYVIASCVSPCQRPLRNTL